MQLPVEVQKRNKKGPSVMLENFKGILQTDGLASTARSPKRKALPWSIAWLMPDAILLKRWISDKDRVEYALDLIQQLYIIEKNCSQQQLQPEECAQVRQEQSLPTLKLLGEWMKHEYALVLPKSPIGKALAYSIKRCDKLSAYVSDGKLHIDNNVENSIRPTAIGRKNYLFAGSHGAAKRSAMLHSLLGTCKPQNKLLHLARRCFVTHPAIFKK